METHKITRRPSGECFIISVGEASGDVMVKKGSEFKPTRFKLNYFIKSSSWHVERLTAAHFFKGNK